MCEWEIICLPDYKTPDEEGWEPFSAVWDGGDIVVVWRRQL